MAMKQAPFDDSPYDFVTYAIKCVPDTDWSGISGNRVERASGESTMDTFETVDRDLLAPKTGKPSASYWKIITEEGDDEIPLYVEFISQADELYYVGRTEDPERRIRTHFQGSDPTTFFDYAEPVEVIDVRYHKVSRSGEWLRNALEHEKSWEKQYGRFAAHRIDSAYDRVINEISDNEELPISQIREWGRQIKNHLQGPNVKTTHHILSILSDMKQEKERELANELIKIDDEGERIKPESIQTYAYWM